MNTKTVLLIAFGLALVLPYVTIAILRGGGRIGTYVIAGIFVSVMALVVLSDRQTADEND